MEQLTSEIRMLIEIYREQMEKKASVGSYTEAARFQIKIAELENVLIMIKVLK